MAKHKGKKGVVVDIMNPRKAMIDAGWGGSKPDRRKRTKPIPWVETVKKIFGVS